MICLRLLVWVSSKIRQLEFGLYFILVQDEYCGAYILEYYYGKYQYKEL